jgi:hypothetical protein
MPLLPSELRCSAQKGSNISSNQLRRFPAPSSPLRSNVHPVEILETRSRRPDRGGNCVGEPPLSSELNRTIRSVRCQGYRAKDKPKEVGKRPVTYALQLLNSTSTSPFHLSLAQRARSPPCQVLYFETRRSLVDQVGRSLREHSDSRRYPSGPGVDPKVELGIRFHPARPFLVI